MWELASYVRVGDIHYRSLSFFLLTHIQTHMSGYKGEENVLFGLLLYLNTNTISNTLCLRHAVGWLKGQVIGANSGITCQPRGILTAIPASAKRPFATILCTSLYLPLWKLTWCWLLFTALADKQKAPPMDNQTNALPLPLALSVTITYKADGRIAHETTKCVISQEP